MTVDEMQGMEAIPPGAEADAILDAFRDFAKAHTTYFLSMSKAPAGVRLLLAGIMPMDNLLKADESSIDASGPPTFLSFFLSLLSSLFFTFKTDKRKIYNPQSLVLKLMETIPTGTGELKSYADNISGQRKMAIKAWDLNLAQKRSFGRAAFRQGLRV